MSTVTISVAAHPLEPGRSMVVAWLSVEGSTHTRGFAEVFIGSSREGLARMAAEALTALNRSAVVVIAMRIPDHSEPAPSSETAAALAKAAAPHTVTYRVVPHGEPDPALEAAERFAKARAAGVGPGPRPSAPTDPPTGLPAIPRKLFS